MRGIQRLEAKRGNRTQWETEGGYAWKVRIRLGADIQEWSEQSAVTWWISTGTSTKVCCWLCPLCLPTCIVTCGHACLVWCESCTRCPTQAPIARINRLNRSQPSYGAFMKDDLWGPKSDLACAICDDWPKLNAKPAQRVNISCSLSLRQGSLDEVTWRISKEGRRCRSQGQQVNLPANVCHKLVQKVMDDWAWLNAA